MKAFVALCVLGAILSLGVALLSAVAIIHADTTAWFIGGVFAYVLAAGIETFGTASRHTA